MMDINEFKTWLLAIKRRLDHIDVPDNEFDSYDKVYIPEDLFKTLIVEDENDGQIRLQMEFNYDRNEETEKDIRLEEDC
jgi:hypothetical protein